jgi:hypothetical protein
MEDSSFTVTMWPILTKEANVTGVAASASGELTKTRAFIPRISANPPRLEQSGGNRAHWEGVREQFGPKPDRSESDFRRRLSSF